MEDMQEERIEKNLYRRDVDDRRALGHLPRCEGELAQPKHGVDIRLERSIEFLEGGGQLKKEKEKRKGKWEEKKKKEEEEKEKEKEIRRRQRIGEREGGPRWRSRRWSCDSLEWRHC